MRRALPIVTALALAAGLLFAYADPLLAMVQRWNNSPMYSYAYTVPLISAFLLWARRDEFARRAMVPARIQGALVLAVALAMLVVGGIGSVQVAQQIGFIVALAGCVLFLFGRAHLALSLPALAYLLFMVPIWDAFTSRLHSIFQNNSAVLGEALIHAIGVPAYREGTIIALPNLVIEVAQECSGVNYLVAVLALALPLAFLWLRAPWRRFVLVVGSLLIAALANGLRVALIAVLAYYEIGSPLHGPMHFLHGLMVAAVGYVALFFGVTVLQKGEELSERPASLQPEPRPSWRVADGAVLAAAFWAIVLAGAVLQIVPVALAESLDSLPSQLGRWSADPRNVEGSAYDEAWRGADQRLSRRYRTSDGRTAIVEVWYFASQGQDREIVSDRTARLHANATDGTIPLRDGRVLRVNVRREGDPEEIAIFWYDLAGTSEANPYAAKARSLWNALTARRSNAAAVLVRTQVLLTAAQESETMVQDLAAEVHYALTSLWAPRGARVDSLLLSSQASRQ